MTTDTDNIESESIEDAGARKQSHLDLALQSQIRATDPRFDYEPMLAGHPGPGDTLPILFGNKEMKFPIWISSMTGGTSKAGPINRMLAKTAARFGFGMGLGSCRIILDDESWLDDFNLRPILGDDLPLFANIGIAQVEQLLARGQTCKLEQLVDRLEADGLIVHVNPLQEWLQPEGDRIEKAPVETIRQLLDLSNIPLIVKEVGQGFGPESMRQLLQLPLLAIDFAASGGTNFARLEMLRSVTGEDSFNELASVGHTANEMIGTLNELVSDSSLQRNCDLLIISGGVRNFLDGYYYMTKSSLPAVYGQAAAFLKAANESQEALDTYAAAQVQGLLLAQQFLRVKQ